MHKYFNTYTGSVFLMKCYLVISNKHLDLSPDHSFITDVQYFIFYAAH